MDCIFLRQGLNFLKIGPINDLRVVKNSNTLSTCYQYEVKDENNDKMLNLKIYDKIMDLVSREGTK